MEGSGSKILYIIAAVVLALLVITLTFGIYNAGKGGVDEGINNINKLTNSMNESRYTDIDGAEILGSQVQSDISLFKDDPVAIAVTTGTGTYYFNYKNSFSQSSANSQVDYVIDESKRITSTSGNEYAKNTAVSKKTEACYVNPSGKFAVDVIRNKNDVIVGVVFTQL